MRLSLVSLTLLAIAGRLASGADIEQAVREAEEYTWNTLARAFRPGMGQFIPDRLFWARADLEPTEKDCAHDHKQP